MRIRTRLPGENDEGRLGYFLRHLGLSDVAQRGGMDHIQMPGDKRLKSEFGSRGGILAHQLHVVGTHRLIHGRQTEKGTTKFAVP